MYKNNCRRGNFYMYTETREISSVIISHPLCPLFTVSDYKHFICLHRRSYKHTVQKCSNLYLHIVFIFMKYKF